MAHLFWSVGLWLWGVGAIVAGSSYQAFGYHLKCRGNRVLWTNWLEVSYLILQQLSINALLVAAAFTSASEPLRSVMIFGAIALSVFYLLLTLWAAFKPVKALLSFEWMSLVSLLPVLWMLGLHSWQAIGTDNSMEWRFVGVWLGLFASMLAYGLYFKFGITQWLWQRGRWFSENDVLHVTLIIWVVYLYMLIPGITVQV